MKPPEIDPERECVKAKTYFLAVSFAVVCSPVLFQLVLGVTAVPRILARLSLDYPMPNQAGRASSLRLAKGLDPGPNAAAQSFLYDAAAFERGGLVGAAHLSLALAAYAGGEKELGEAHEAEAAQWSAAAAPAPEERRRFDAEVIAFPARKAAALAGGSRQTPP